MSDILKAVKELDCDSRINKWFTTVEKKSDESFSDWFKILDEIS